MQQELTEVAQALDPIPLLHQLEQLQQAVFRCAVGCAPVISPIPSTPIRVFSVQECTAGSILAEGRTPDLEAGIHRLYREQERRKRVLGWRHTHKDPFAGEWEQIISWLVANPERAAATFSGNCSAALPDAISPCKSAHSNGGCEKYESPSCILERSSGKRK